MILLNEELNEFEDQDKNTKE